jgi:hypothetical protein
MSVADKYRLVAENLRVRAATPEAAGSRDRLWGLALQFDEVAIDAEKEEWGGLPPV